MLHCGFWALSFVILYRLFTVDYSGGLSDLIYTLLFHLPLLLLVYGNIYVHRRLVGRSAWAFAASAIFLLALGVAFHFIIFEILSDFLAPGFYFISYYSVGQIIQFLLSYLVISTLLILSLNWFDLQKQHVHLERENQAAKLRNLKAQVNPHFLINSLNNIYSLTDNENQTTRNYLIKLSDALRYMVYETEEDRVLLQSELQYVRNYVALEKLRMEETLDFKFEESGNFEGFVIAPLILIPFIENCFKHCHRASPEIRISFSMIGSWFHLTTYNNLEGGFSTTHGGIGLNNVETRLQMIYSKKHDLQITHDDRSYSVDLKIDLS